MTRDRRVALVLALLGVAVTTTCTKPAEPTVPQTGVDSNRPADGQPRIVASADDVLIRYRVYGRGKPVLIFVHGWAADSTYWDAQIDHFKARHTVVTLDLAGHGESGTARAAWTMDSFGDDVVAVAERVPGEQLVLIGHSMGGPAVLQAARRLRDRVIGIVGVDTFANIGLQPATPAELERRLAPFREDFAAATREYVTRSFFTPRSDPVLMRRLVDDLAAAPPGIAVGEMIGMNDMNYAAALADIDVPVIAINATRVPIDLERIRLHARTFRLKLVDGAGHFLMLEEPARFNAELDQTLRELADSRR